MTANDDRPGVIGDVGTMFGRHGVNIASFALGRSGNTAVGVITVDEGVGLDTAVEEYINNILPKARETLQPTPATAD